MRFLRSALALLLTPVLYGLGVLTFTFVGLAVVGNGDANRLELLGWGAAAGAAFGALWALSTWLGRDW